VELMVAVKAEGGKEADSGEALLAVEDADYSADLLLLLYFLQQMVHEGVSLSE